MPGIPPRVASPSAAGGNEGLAGLGSELCSHRWKRARGGSVWGLPRLARAKQPQGCVPGRLQGPAERGKGLPVGQEGARAPGCGKGCWGSLRGACGWAVLPSCMPASQGHGLQKKTRAFLCICPCILSSSQPLDGGSTFTGPILQVCELRCTAVKYPARGHPAQKWQG